MMPLWHVWARSMQIKAAITDNLVFINISVIIHGIKIILVAIPMF